MRGALLFQGQKVGRRDLLRVDHQLGARAGQYCSQPRNFLSIAFNNGSGPDVLKVANRVHLASRPSSTSLSLFTVVSICCHTLPSSLFASSFVFQRESRSASCRTTQAMMPLRSVAPHRWATEVAIRRALKRTSAAGRRSKLRNNARETRLGTMPRADRKGPSRGLRVRSRRPP